MIESMLELSHRIKSSIPTPVARYGYVSTHQGDRQLKTYDGTTLTYFLMTQKASPNYREFLRQNKVGRFTDLDSGRSVVIAGNDDLTKHPDY